MAAESGAEPERPRIVKLEETVVNRIAAGEVVVRPANALKELMENSIDAGSRRIMVSVKAGGLKMLRIEDDGHGIRAADLPILCERFTTSKLRKYEDLSSIGTFGFRGEALASVSHVAHVTVCTMTKEDSCARTASYDDGVMKAPPKPCAGTVGTTIVAEDLFYNNPTRRAALGKDSVEYTRVLEVIQRYAVHYPKLSFSCRKAGSSSAELQTLGGEAASARDAVGVIYGHSLAKELFDFAFSSEEPRFSCRGLATGPNWTARNGSLVLFINNRLVECPLLKRAVDAVFMPVLPKHQHPWVYLALEVSPETIDVNVHPTKSEVQFLHEELICQRLQEVLAAELAQKGGCRTFESKVPLLGEAKPKAEESKPEAPRQQRSFEEPKRVDLNPTRVRTDHLQQSLTSIWRPQSQVVELDEPAADATQVDEARLAAFEEAQRLTSVCELKAAASLAADAELVKKLNQSVYVGPATRELALLQCGTALCLANMEVLLRECGYQRLLRRFGGPGAVVLKRPLPLQELLVLGVQDPRSGYEAEKHGHVAVDELAAQLAGLLADKAELLKEYLMLEVEGGKLLSVPNALGLESEAGLHMEGLPLFLLRLAMEADWSEEKACFRSLCSITAEFMAEAVLPEEEEQESAAAAVASMNEAVARGDFEDVAQAAAARAKRMRTAAPGAGLQGLRWAHELLRRDGQCLWPAAFSKDGTVLDLVSLDQLYRIFERC